MHRNAGPFLTCALLLLVLPGVAAAQKEFEGAVTMNMNMGGAMSVDVVSLTKAGKVRQEMSMLGQEVISIIDMSTGTGLMLMPLQKTYMKLDFNALAQRTESLPPPTITAVGTSETILGHRCEHYSVEMPTGTTSICVATDLGFYMGSLNAQGGGIAGSSNLQAYNELFRTKFKDGFFPLKMTVTSQGMSMTLVVSSIEQKSVPDEQFELAAPADYTEMKMPARSGGASGGRN